VDADSQSRHKARERAAHLIRQLPDQEKLGRFDDEITEILNDPPRETDVRLIVGTMLDGFQRKPAEGSAVFVDAFVYVLEDMSANGQKDMPDFAPLAAIAAATREVWLTMDWPPSIKAFAELSRRHTAVLVKMHGEIHAVFQKKRDLAELVALVRPADFKPATPSGFDDEIPF
jgi:hypothetical protein